VRLQVTQLIGLQKIVEFPTESNEIVGLQG